MRVVDDGVNGASVGTKWRPRRRGWDRTAVQVAHEDEPARRRMSLYDIAGTPGVAADVGHVNTAAQTKGYAGGELAEALKDADVVIVGERPAETGMAAERWPSAESRQGIGEAIADNARAMINMISNPVNSTVPIAAEVLKAKGKCGEEALEVARLTSSGQDVYAERRVSRRRASTCRSSVVTRVSRLPLFSQATPKANNLSADDIDALTSAHLGNGRRGGGAKASKGSATLSMAYAGALFADACLRARMARRTSSSARTSSPR